jgi:hypothetical protein
LVLQKLKTVLHPLLIKGRCFKIMREFCSWTTCHTRPLGMPTLYCLKFKEAIKKERGKVTRDALLIHNEGLVHKSKKPVTAIRNCGFG